MDKSISGEFRREFEQMFAACATANPHIGLEDRDQCEKALDLVEQVVRGTLARGVPTYIEADDLIQVCLMRLPDAIAGYRGKNGASLKTYLKTVIRHDVMDAIETERREPCSGGVPFSRVGGDDDDGDGLIANEGPTDRKRAATDYSLYLSDSGDPDEDMIPRIDLTVLTDEQLDVVRLCDILDETQESAATSLGITRNAVASRLRKAHAKLRRYQNH